MPHEASDPRPQTRSLLYVLAFLVTFSGAMWVGTTVSQQLKKTFDGGSFDYSTLPFGILLSLVGWGLLALARRRKTQP